MNKDKNTTDLKTFSEHTEVSKASAATEKNDGRLDIASDASDSEAFETALLQNIAMAMTEPDLAPVGRYPLVRYPRTGLCAWRIDFHKEIDSWAFSFNVSPRIKEMFFDKVEGHHESYKHFMSTRKSNEEYTGVETCFPPWIAQLVEIQTGAEFGSEEFYNITANDQELRKFWINKQAMAKYRNKKL